MICATRKWPQLLAMCCLLLFRGPGVLAEEDDDRFFLFVGTPSAAAWQFLMENPEDRKAATEGAMAEIGGEVLSYWFGLGDGRNYIIARLPNDNELIQAVYLMRLPSGLLASYEMIELMPSEQMSAALRRSAELIEMEKQVGGPQD